MRRTVGLWSVAVGILAALCGAGAANAETPVSGYIENAAGVPVNGTMFYRAEGEQNSSGWTVTNGNFTGVIFDEVKDYTFRVVASRNMDDYSRWYQTGTPEGLPTDAGATVFDIVGTPLVLNMTIPTIATLSGRVTAPGGAGVPNVTVFRNRLGSISSTTTNSTGNYTFGYVREGTVNVTTSSTTTLQGGQAFVTLPASGQVTQDFSLGQIGSVSGTVTDLATGAPLPNINVNAYRAADTAYQGGDRTDAAGNFQIAGVGPGNIVLRFDDPLNGYPSRFSGDKLVIGEATQIPTMAGDDVTFSQALAQHPDPFLNPHSMSGTVTRSGGGTLGGIDVTATAEGGATTSTTTDRRGRWVLAVPAGQYTVRFDARAVWAEILANPWSWFSQYYPSAWDAAHAQKVTVPSAASADGIDTQLVEAGLLRITVSTPALQSVGVGYRIVDSTGATVTDIPASQANSSQISLTVKPGTYRILARGVTTGTPTPLVAQWYALTGAGTTFAKAFPLTVNAGQTVEGELLRLPTTLRGITPPTIAGTAAAGHTVTAGPGNWNQHTDTTFGYRWSWGWTTLATTAAYRVRPADAGRSLTLTVTGTHAGLRGTSTRTVRIARLGSRTTSTVGSPASGVVRLVVTVRGGELTPTGRVVIKRGATTVGSGRLVAGKATVRMTGQARGSARYQVSYLGSARHQPSRSGVLRVVVR